MNTKFSELVQYFREIATQHIEIGHSATENHFYRFEIDEVLIGVKNGQLSGADTGRISV